VNVGNGDQENKLRKWRGGGPVGGILEGLAAFWTRESEVPSRRLYRHTGTGKRLTKRVEHATVPPVGSLLGKESD
jgi:hypothetical protein